MMKELYPNSALLAFQVDEAEEGGEDPTAAVETRGRGSLYPLGEVHRASQLHTEGYQMMIKLQALLGEFPGVFQLQIDHILILL